MTTTLTTFTLCTFVSVITGAYSLAGESFVGKDTVVSITQTESRKDNAIIAGATGLFSIYTGVGFTYNIAEICANEKKKKAKARSRENNKSLVQVSESDKQDKSKNNIDFSIIDKSNAISVYTSEYKPVANEDSYAYNLADDCTDEKEAQVSSILNDKYLVQVDESYNQDKLQNNSACSKIDEADALGIYDSEYIM